MLFTHCMVMPWCGRASMSCFYEWNFYHLFGGKCNIYRYHNNEVLYWLISYQCCYFEALFTYGWLCKGRVIFIQRAPVCWSGTNNKGVCNMIRSRTPHSHQILGMQFELSGLSLGGELGDLGSNPRSACNNFPLLHNHTLPSFTLPLVQWSTSCIGVRLSTHVIPLL